MGKFNSEDLKHLKKLCRIDCSPEEEQDILQSLTRVLDFMAQLNEIPTEGIKSCRYVLRGMLKNQGREDEIKETLPREEFLSNAPDQIGGMIRVPPILKANG